MQAVANNPKFAKKVGVPTSVGKEFTKKEGTKMKYAKGGKTLSQKIYEVEYEIGGKKHTSQFLMP